MSALVWTVVLGINGAIILFGIWKSRETTSAADWFLAARGLPWWMVGLSMFATAVDSGDYVAVAGESYRSGMSYISAWWIGIGVGWLVAAYLVFLPMYRQGMYTNSEYLEYRFGPLARLISVGIQIQYRTNVLGNVAFSLYLVFSALTGWGDNTWWLVGTIAAGAAVYTASGGLKSVALTDSLQSIVMMAAAFLLWWSVWEAVGGWSGMEERLTRQSPEIAQQMLHVGAETQPGVPGILVVIGWVIALTAYCVVNHSQSMRMLAARSEWDVKMAAVVAAAVTALVMWFNVTLGLMGRGLYPDLEQPDRIFSLLIQDHLSEGLLAVVLAGLLAGGISTFDSIGSALAAVFTRDVYARFLVPRASDRHYVRVSQVTTVVVIALSFGYIPFMGVGMVELYLELIGVAVIPLLTVYMMGILTRVHRSAGTIGLVVGMICGLTRFADKLPIWTVELPIWWSNKWWGYPWSIAVTALAMLVTTWIRGRATDRELRGLTYSTSHLPRETDPVQGVGVPTGEGWLDTSRVALLQQRSDSEPVVGWYANPLVWSILVFGTICVLNLVVFW
jgi:SSS family solute:Na+ symporter